MRTSGALICSLSIVTVGFLITYKLVAKSKQIRDIIAFINSIEQSIKYKKDTLYNIINGLKNDETYSFLFNSTNKNALLLGGLSQIVNIDSSALK